MKNDNKYAYTFLNDSEKELYQIIYNSMVQGQCIVCCKKKYTLMEINKIVKYILLDSPELFWFEGKWGYKDLGSELQLIFRFTMPWENVLECKCLIETEIEKIIATVQGDEIQKARMLYGWLQENVSYGKRTTGQNIKDVLIMRDAVCKGLSKAYQLLLAQVGIFSVLAEGSIDGTTKHIWNVVKLNEKYYHADLAMSYKEVQTAMGIEEDSDAFFGISDATMRKYCRIDEMGFPFFGCEKDLTDEKA